LKIKHEKADDPVVVPKPTPGGFFLSFEDTEVEKTKAKKVEIDKVETDDQIAAR
jgi:hypothetical protein